MACECPSMCVRRSVDVGVYGCVCVLQGQRSEPPDSENPLPSLKPPATKQQQNTQAGRVYGCVGAWVSTCTSATLPPLLFRLKNAGPPPATLDPWDHTRRTKTIVMLILYLLYYPYFCLFFIFIVSSQRTTRGAKKRAPRPCDHPKHRSFVF
jgi:hypothetical protein